MISKLKKHKKRPTWIPESVLASWVELWKHPDVISVSKRNSQNRLSGGADGLGPACHTGGSISLAVHLKRLVSTFLCK